MPLGMAFFRVFKTPRGYAKTSEDSSTERHIGIMFFAAAALHCSGSTAVFRRPQKLSVGALSQQLHFLLIDERMPQSFKALWNSWLQYWLPLSLGNITPGGGLRRHHAMACASLTRLACTCGCRLQPTTDG